MTRSDPIAEAQEGSPALAAFLPLSVVRSLIGRTHIADSKGATFLDRAYQLRGFELRRGFKDEWDSLAPQIVEAINSHGALKAAAAEAVGALREVSGVSLPAHAQKALRKALMALSGAMEERS